MMKKRTGKKNAKKRSAGWQSAGMRSTVAALLALGMAVSAGLTGCGSAAGDSGAMPEAAYYAEDAGASLKSAEVSDMAPEEYGESDQVSGRGLENVLTGQEAPVQTPDSQSGKKLIKNVTIQAETLEYDKQLKFIQSKVTELGGYIESISTSDSGYGDVREAYLTARIPYDKVDTFDEEVGKATKVTYQSESVEDVTLQYVDLESHKKSLAAEQTRLLELLQQAQTIDEIISIEDRLTNVRYQLESMESQLRMMDNQVSYSTVNLTLREVEKYEPAKDISAWEEIREGFSENVDRVIYGLQRFVIWFAISIPFFALVVIAGIVILVIVLVIVRVDKHHTRKVQKKREKQRQDALKRDEEGKKENE